jgi:hypothetical protein
MSAILDEAAFGAGVSTDRLRSMMGGQPDPLVGGGTVPLIRIEFP